MTMNGWWGGSGCLPNSKTSTDFRHFLGLPLVRCVVAIGVAMAKYGLFASKARMFIQTFLMLGTSIST